MKFENWKCNSSNVCLLLILQLYGLAVAGPNGVELYRMELGDIFAMVSNISLNWQFGLSSFISRTKNCFRVIFRVSPHRYIQIWPLHWCNFLLINNSWLWYVVALSFLLTWNRKKKNAKSPKNGSWKFRQNGNFDSWPFIFRGRNCLFVDFQAALDGHFGIWTVSSLDTDQKGYFHLKCFNRS